MKRVLPVLFLVAAAALAWDFQRQLTSPLALTSPITVNVPAGAGLGGVLRDWHAQRALFSTVRQRRYTGWHARLFEIDAAIHAGEYRLEPGLDPLGLLALLAKGRTLQHELVLIEGWNFAQVLTALSGHPAIKTTRPHWDGAAVMAALGRPELHPEGRFFPDTYRFPRGMEDIEFLARAFRTLQSVLEAEWTNRAAAVPYAGPDEALVMASIIEKETSVAQERGRIAGVFVRRLLKGMRLQTDPTVIYGLGDAFDGNLRRRDLRRDTAYNTYTRAGLPPTPICLPGRASIHAALHPAEGDSLYFVARGDGSHQFSTTLEEHEAAVDRFQRGRGS